MPHRRILSRAATATGRHNGVVRRLLTILGPGGTSAFMGEETTTLTEPGDAPVRTAHEVSAVGIPCLVGHEDVIVTVEREPVNRFVARRAQPAIRSPQLVRDLLEGVGFAEGGDERAPIPAFIRR